MSKKYITTELINHRVLLSKGKKILECLVLEFSPNQDFVKLKNKLNSKDFWGNVKDFYFLEDLGINVNSDYTIICEEYHEDF
jgi:hypothetical protein